MQAEAGGYWEHGELVAEALQRVAVLSAFAVTLQTSFWCIQGFAEAMLTEEEDMSRRMLGSGLAYLNLIISGVLLVL